MREVKGDVELARDSTLDRAVDEPELTVRSAWCAFSEVRNMSARVRDGVRSNGSTLSSAKRLRLHTSHTQHVAESLACFLCVIVLGQRQGSPFTRRRRQSPRSASIRCKTGVSHCSFTGRPILSLVRTGAASPVSTLEARSSRRD